MISMEEIAQNGFSGWIFLGYLPGGVSGDFLKEKIGRGLSGVNLSVETVREMSK